MNPRAWECLPLTWDAAPLFRHRSSGEPAIESPQTGHLLSLDPETEAAIRRLLKEGTP